MHRLTLLEESTESPYCFETGLFPTEVENLGSHSKLVPQRAENVPFIVALGCMSVTPICTVDLAQNLVDHIDFD